MITWFNATFRKANISLRLAFVLLLLIAGQDSVYAAVSGSKCSKAGLTEVSNQKLYTCIKLGSKLYWNNGVGYSPNDVVFYQIHRTSNSEDLLRIQIDALGNVKSKKVLTSGPKMELRMLDVRNRTILLSEGISDEQLYVYQEKSGARALQIPVQGGIPSDARQLSLFKLSLDGQSILSFDYDSDFYQIDIRNSSPSWVRLVKGDDLEVAIAAAGADPSKDWISDFEVMSDGRIFFLTENSSTGHVMLWWINQDFRFTGVPRVQKITEFDSSAELGVSIETAISPDGKNIAILHEVSALTPKNRIKIFNVASESISEVSASRLYTKGIYFISWLGNSSLIMTYDLVWKNDKDGGRVTCKLNLKDTKSCMDLNGISGYSLVGSR